jgi:dUTP pyrophosphatase
MRIKQLRPTDVPLPAYQTTGAAGMDLYWDFDGYEVTTFEPGEFGELSTNVAVEIPEGFEGQVRGRSGLAFRFGVVGYNGTIDSDYRGEIKALLFNFGDDPVTIRRGDRIAQLVISPVARVELERVEELSDSVRGENGFGSTGRRPRVDVQVFQPEAPTPCRYPIGGDE